MNGGNGGNGGIESLALDELFDRVVELAPDAHDDFLSRHCEGRPGLRRQVEELLDLDMGLDGQGARGKGVDVWRPDGPGGLAARASRGLSSEASSIAPGARIGPYIVMQKLGRGGMAHVYLARHDELDTRVVVKVLDRALARSPEMIRRFEREARAAARIDHPGIVRILDAGQHVGGDLYILMEYLEGENLEERLERIGRMTESVAVGLIHQAAQALAAVHARGVIHRDLKPANLFLVRDLAVAGGERLEILDFGIAKLLESPPGLETRTGVLMGTPAYMSPEQCLGARRVDHRSDLYALGVIVFEMVCGRRPFECAGAGEYVMAHTSEPPPAVHVFAPGISPGLAGVIARLLAKKPANRFASADDLEQALIDVARGHAPGSGHESGHESGHDQGTPANRETDRTDWLQTLWTDEPDPATRSRYAPIQRTTCARSDVTVGRRGAGATLDNAAAELGRVERPGTLRRGITSAVAVAAMIAATTGLWIADVSIQDLANMIAAGISHSSDAGQVDATGPDDSTDAGPAPRAPSRLAVDRPTLEAIALVGATSEPARRVPYDALHGDASLVTPAAHTLRELAMPDMSRAIREVLPRYTGAARAELAMAMVELGDDDAVGLLRQVLDDDDSRIALAAAVTLARAGRAGEPERQILRDTFASASRGGEPWREAARGLASLGDPAVRRALAQEMAHPDSLRVVNAAAILARGVEFEPADLQGGALEVLRRKCERLDGAQNAAVARRAAALALARLGDRAALAFVPDGIASDHPDDRRVAIAVASRLAPLGGDVYRPFVRALYRYDSDEQVRLTARVGLLMLSR